MERKLISIIIPTYNCGHKIEGTLKSVLSQRRELFEIIVVDGLSTDGTVGIVQKYAGELKFVSERDGGTYEALNKGIGMASGKYLFFLGAGDCLRDGVLERLAGSLPEEKLAFVYGNVYLMKHGRYYGGEFRKSDLRNRNICHQAIFYERTIFNVGGRYESRYRLFADWALNMKCFGDPGVRKVFVDLAITDFEEGGISETQEDPDFERDFPSLIRKYLGPREYVRHKTYTTRVQLYLLRRRLRGAVLSAALPSVSLTERANSSYGAKEEGGR